MSSYQQILDKLNAFIKRYYTKQLVKGSLLFIAIGLLFWIAVISLEQLLWLNTAWRFILFWIFIGVELFLLYRFIALPLIYLFQLKKGISYEYASKLIGKHFHQVDDKLFNLLELANNAEKSELLIASIEQRSDSLGDVPFIEAVNIKESLKYTRYALVPLLVIALIWIFGGLKSFFGSQERIVNYDLAYQKPAPFQFVIVNNSLKVLDNEPYTLKVAVVGDVQPEDVFMVVDGEELLLKKEDGFYVYTFDLPLTESWFYLTANGWSSPSYILEVVNTPVLKDFEMKFDFPTYLHKSPEVISGSGNGVIPEGTKVTWSVNGEHVDAINIFVLDSTYAFTKNEQQFFYENRVFNDLDYELSTSNSEVVDFERLGYRLEVIKDEMPTIEVEQIRDTLNPNQSFYVGQVADDYGLRSVRLVYYSEGEEKEHKVINLERPTSNVHQFYYTFPSGIDVTPGVNYEFYFEVVDNDGIRGGKVTKSQVFQIRFYNDNELKSKELELQDSLLEDIDKSLDIYQQQEEQLERINDNQKENKTLSFEDQNEIKEFLKKQERQEQQMERFSKQLKESLSKSDTNSETNKMLQERLERQELEAKKNEQLLKELNELSDKINKEELKKRLEELGKKQSSGARNLEQILELTKRYYVTEKASQLSKELEKLSQQQEILSELKLGEEFSNSEQEKLNKEFDNLSEELKELEKDNQQLQKPINLDVDDKQSEGVKQDQKEALEEINKHQGLDTSSDSDEKEKTKNRAVSKQKSAAQKMKEMSQSLKQGAAGGGSETIMEDAEMLRQILDNLVTFSFKQEGLFEKVESADIDIAQFSRIVKDQKELRRLFEHVDDSLFALSLRRAELSEFVNEEITEVYYNIDKSLESIAENQIYQGASYQQYVVNATNKLADFLANILDNMQQNMSPGQGKGSGQDFQLPDIIKGQESIQQQMNGQGKEGKESQSQSGENGQGKEQQGKQEGKQEGEDDGDTQGKDGEKGGSEKGNFGERGDELGLSEIYEIYKEQQHIKEQLEQQLKDMLNQGDRDLAKKLIRQMEDFQNDLLENGITNRTKSKANSIQHQLLKLENAVLEQGKKQERKSNTNSTEYSNPITTRPEALRDYQNDIEILNRQALPLRQNYEKKVKVYFKND
ncbi:MULTISPECIES: hypothetical protein [Flavobacteriaceae]|uniref:hypothetical protein n=1 Tax=Flavobacteriaceae TaxID=49546 RepID=UPI001490B1DF|nr:MULTISPECIES: hypothetical protein [Allomuricauda]MDC6365166.1 hypothetical protein [Muricauda sp. AC10]